MEELSNLPPTAWVLIVGAAAVGFGISWLWRWYRNYSARKALRAAVTAAGSDHLVDMLVPDGMGGGFHVDFLLLTGRGVLVVDLRDVQGNIFGGDQMADWTVMDGPRRFTRDRSSLQSTSLTRRSGWDITATSGSGGAIARSWPAAPSRARN